MPIFKAAPHFIEPFGVAEASAPVYGGSWPIRDEAESGPPSSNVPSILDHTYVRRRRILHADDMVARVDMENFAGDAP
jgi:hypothetical protein